uniref:Uncharacterized protein n=1 Tax=Arundo donax TaxID=35708 RepID=A0A0A9DFN6_ARUDO
MINAVYSSTRSRIFDSLFADAVRVRTSLSSSSVIRPSAFLSTMSKKVWSLASKPGSESCSQNSRS